MSKNRWKYTCPICKKKVEEKYTQPYIKKGWIGATHNCPCCGGLLIINKDLTCSDFGDELVMRYKEMGINVSKEKATSTYITVKSN